MADRLEMAVRPTQKPGIGDFTAKEAKEFLKELSRADVAARLQVHVEEDVLLRHAEMLSRSHRVSASYSCNDPCPPNFDAFVTPGSEIVALSNSATLTAWETSIDSAGTIMGPFAASGTWSASNPSVCTLNSPDGGHTCVATATGEGFASILVDLGFFDFWIWDGLNCFLAGSGKLFGENDFEVKHSCTIRDSGGMVGGIFTECNIERTITAQFTIEDVPSATPPIAAITTCSVDINPDIQFSNPPTTFTTSTVGSQLIVNVEVKYKILTPGTSTTITITCGVKCEDGTTQVANHSATVQCVR